MCKSMRFDRKGVKDVLKFSAAEGCIPRTELGKPVCRLQNILSVILLLGQSVDG